MAQHLTHKDGFSGKLSTLNRRNIRRAKYATHPLDVSAVLGTLPLTH